MPHVRFTRHLRRYFPELDAVDVPGETVAEVVRELDRRFPGLASYIVDERGALRKHVNVFVDQELVRDRERLGDAVTDRTVLDVIQALSGG